MLAFRDLRQKPVGCSPLRWVNRRGAVLLVILKESDYAISVGPDLEKVCQVKLLSFRASLYRSKTVHALTIILE
jgi:hypothetical protein